MTGFSETSHGEVGVRAAPERPFAVVLVNPPWFRRRPIAFARLFKSPNQILLFWLFSWLFWIGLALAPALGVLGAQTVPPFSVIFFSTGIPLGVLIFLSQRVELPDDGDLQVGSKIGDALVICRIGPFAMWVALAIYLGAVAAYLSRQFGVI